MNRKIVIIDGGPRRNMNTAQMAASFAEGVRSAGSDIDIKQYRLYDIDYRGCMSCLACKATHKPTISPYRIDKENAQ